MAAAPGAMGPVLNAPSSASAERLTVSRLVSRAHVPAKIRACDGSNCDGAVSGRMAISIATCCVLAAAVVVVVALALAVVVVTGAAVVVVGAAVVVDALSPSRPLPLLSNPVERFWPTDFLDEPP